MKLLTIGLTLLMLGGCVSGEQARFFNIENNLNADNGSSIDNSTTASVPVQPYSDLNLLKP